MRADGTPLQGLSPIVAAIPYIMPKRYDAQNMTTETVDEEIIRNYIRLQRRQGRDVTHMSLLVAAYYKAYLENPKLNCFVVNRKVYMRNHFCFSFVILKTRADGTPDETTLKVFIDPQDTIFTLTEKITEMIRKNSEESHSNGTDKFANFVFAVPGLARLVFGLVYHMDLHGLLPRKIIDLSPFHTSLFVTNLASINTSFIYHHCYEFGTTSVFICMGKPVVTRSRKDQRQKVMPLGIVMDERICTGIEYARFASAFNHYLQNPELLEQPMGVRQRPAPVSAAACAKE
ncbi:MAG: 2-oxo acid dehydrogenase subunit E2 [Oscillibacter sp.]|jgi:hypothetical protein|nr:2-oxo acid dehydrogenase subunit E2 [Oscillibacter sp.]